MKRTFLYSIAGMFLILMLAGCGNPAVSTGQGNLRDTSAMIGIASSKAFDGIYAQDDIKHLFLKAFQVDANGAYHVLPNLTTDPDTILADGGNLTEFPKTGTDPETGNPIYSGMLKLNPDNIGVRFIVWAVSYNDYTYVVAERDARAQLATAEQNLADAIADRDTKKAAWEKAEQDVANAWLDYQDAADDAWYAREDAVSLAAQTRDAAYAAAADALAPYQDNVFEAQLTLNDANEYLVYLQGEEAAAYTVWQDAVAAGAPPAEQQALYDIWYDLHNNQVPAAESAAATAQADLASAQAALSDAEDVYSDAIIAADAAYSDAVAAADLIYNAAVAAAYAPIPGLETARDNAFHSYVLSLSLVTTCQGAVTAAETAIDEAVTAGEASGYRVLYHVQADRNWTAMSAFNMTMMEGTFDIGDTGPAGGVILDKTEEPVDFMHEDAPDYVDCYSEIAPRDCGIVMAWIDAEPAAANDHINGFTDWMVPDGDEIWRMMKITKDMALFADGQKYWTSWEGNDNPDTHGWFIYVDYPSLGTAEGETPKTDKLRLRAIRYTISATGYGEGMLLPVLPLPPP